MHKYVRYSVFTCGVVTEKRAVLNPPVSLKTAVMSLDKRNTWKWGIHYRVWRKRNVCDVLLLFHVCLCQCACTRAYMHMCTNTEAHKQNTESQCLKTKAALRNKRRPKKPSRHPQQAPIVINENKYWERVGHRRRETAQTMEQTA